MRNRNILASGLAAVTLAAGCGGERTTEAVTTAPPTEPAETYQSEITTQPEPVEYQPTTYRELIEGLNYEAAAAVKPKQEFIIKLPTGATRFYNLTAETVDEAEVTRILKYLERQAESRPPVNLRLELEDGRSGDIPLSVTVTPQTHRYMILIPETFPMYDHPGSRTDESAVSGYTVTIADHDMLIAFARDNEQKTLFTELCQSTLQVTAAAADTAAYGLAVQGIGQESVCNSYGRALRYAEKGLSYEQFQKETTKKYAYRGYGTLEALPFSEQEYLEIQQLLK